MSLLDTVRGKIAEQKKIRDERQAELDEIVAAAESEQRDLNADEAEKFTEARQAVVAADSELDQLVTRERELVDDEARKAAAAKIRPAAQGGAVITSEARTYDKHQTGRSFFADAYRAQFQADPDAQERIARHRRESDVEYRDLTTSTFNGLIPPRYLLDQAAELARPMRPFADVVPSYPLPPDGMSMVFTKVTTGTETDVQTAQNTAAKETDLVTTDVTVPVITIMGQQDLSRQALERGAVTDQLVMNDLYADYATKIDRQWLFGAGTGGESKGVLTAATQTQTWTGTTAASFISKVIGAANDVASNRYAPATVVVMHPRRWHWLIAQADTAGRPIALANSALAQNPQATGGTAYGIGAGVLVGPGLPVVVDANVPSTLGASTNEDRVIVTRLSDLLAWEGAVMPFTFEQASANAPATVRLAVMGYSAFSAEKYTSATSVIVGSGLVPPTF